MRPLSTEERGWIQTFPKGFIFEGSKTNLEQLIGNAVPMKLAEYVAKAILEYLDAKSDPHFDHKYRQKLEIKPMQTFMFD